MWGSLPFRAEVWTKTQSKNSMGQVVATWTKNRTIHISFMSSRGEERLVGFQQNPQSYNIWTNDINVGTENQIRNLADRYGTVLDNGKFNVAGIRKGLGWSKMSHLTLNIQRELGDT